jgi:hypothetical protein
MNRWHPAPRAIIDDELMRRWTKENPAPDLVIHMVLVSRIESGAPWTKGKLSRWAGVTDYKARQCIAAAEAWLKEWTEPQLQTSTPFNRIGDEVNNRTHSIISTTCDTDSTAIQPQKTANQPLARASSSSTRTHTPHTHVGLSVKPDEIESPATPDPEPTPKPDELGKLWTDMEAIRLRHVKGRTGRLGKRRDTLRRRVAEHSVDIVLHAWLWLWESSHKRAQYLRDEGYGVNTFLRASNLRDYVDMSAGWDKAQEIDKATTQAIAKFDIFNTTDDDFDEHGNLIWPH